MTKTIVGSALWFWFGHYIGKILYLEYCFVVSIYWCALFLQQVSSDVAVVHPTVEPPPPYTPASSWEANAATVSANEELRRRQEELERKAAELQRREDEIQRNMQYQGLLVAEYKKFKSKKD